MTIKGRAKRFAKVAGEMVPLGAVEDFVAKLWPDESACGRDRCPTRSAASSSCSSPIVRMPIARRWRLPRARPACRRSSCRASIVLVAKVPILGTGKIDYVSASQLATELVRAS